MLGNIDLVFLCERNTWLLPRIDEEEKVAQ
jgi:hypothetical protein